MKLSICLFFLISNVYSYQLYHNKFKLSSIRKLSTNIRNSNINSDDNSNQFIDQETADETYIIPTSTPKNKKITDIILLTSKGNQVFDFSTTNNNILTKDIFNQWEKLTNEVLLELKQVTKRDNILTIYKSILTKAAPITLDPLQFATFELFSNVLVDNLLATFPVDAPISYLIESVTELHMEFIDQFIVLIDDGGSDG